MGSLSGSTYQNAAVLALALAVCGAVILLHAQILNAFAVGEDNARQIGVDVKRAKLVLLITVSVLIGVCVSIGEMCIRDRPALIFFSKCAMTLLVGYVRQKYRAVAMTSASVMR